MEKKNMAKRNVLQMSLGSNKNPTNITVAGHDKNVEISFNSKCNKNIWIPTSTITGRRIRQCCLHKHPSNEIMLTLPENGRFLVRNGLPLIIESQYLENFKAAFYSPQLLDHDTEPIRETVSCPTSDYSEKIRDKNQCLALEGSETLSKKEQKKYSLMKQIHTLKRSLGEIGEALKEIGEYQAGIQREENQRIRSHDLITDKCKQKRSVKPDKSITSRKSDKHLACSKSEKYFEKMDSLSQIITITPVGKASQGKRKTDSLPPGNKVLDHATIKKQTKQEDKPRRNNNQISKHCVREDDFALAEETMAKLADNMKSTQLLLNDILQEDQIITDIPVEDASQTKIKTVAPLASNKVLDHAVIEEKSKKEVKPRRKENMINSHSIIEDDFVSAGKTMSKLADNMERSKLMVDNILPLDQIITDTPVDDSSQTKIKTVTPPDGFVSAEETNTELADNVKRSKLIVNGILHPDQNKTDTSAEEDPQRKTDSLTKGNKILNHAKIEKQTKQEDKSPRKESQIDNNPVTEDDFASAEKTVAEFADTVKSSRLMLDDILQREKSMNAYKKKYIQEVEALYEDQQRIIEGICRIYDCFNLASSEECTLDKTSANQQQYPENKADMDSEFRSDFEETSEEGTRTYKSNSMPVIGNIVKKRNLEEQLALKNVQLEKLMKEIQILKSSRINEAGKVKSGMIRKDRQTQETATETSGDKTAIDEGPNTNSDSSAKEVTGIISYTYEILKGEQCESNIYETTLTHTVKKFPSIIDESKYAKLSNAEYIEALSDAQTAMRKLEATFQKLIPVLPKISQQSGVDSDALIEASHREENISGKILKEQKVEISNGSENVPKDKTKRHVETQTESKDEKLASGRQYISFERIQEDRAREQADSEEFSPRKTNSGEHVSSAETVKKSKGVTSAEIESQRLKESKDSSKTEISSQSKTVPKRYDSNKGSMGFEFKDDTFDEEFLEKERGSVKTIKIPEYSHKIEKQFIFPSAVRREHFNQYLDDMPQPFQPLHSNMEYTRINHDQESAPQVRVSPSYEDPINFRRYSSIMSKPDEEKNIHLSEKSPAGKNNKLRSDVIEEISISQYELEPSQVNDRKSDEDHKFKNNVIERVNIYNISQNELEPSQEDRRKSKGDTKFRRDIIEERTISGISPYELEQHAQNRSSLNKPSKRKSDVIEEGSITSISQYEFEEPDRRTSGARAVRNSNEHSRSWYVPDEYTGSTLSVPDSEEFNKIEEGNRRVISKQKTNNSQQGHTSSNERSRSWYVPEYFEYSGSEPDSREYNQIEEGNISDISKHKLNTSEQGHSSSNENSRSWYVPEYFEYTGSEPDSREYNQIEEGNISDISKHKLNTSEQGYSPSNENSRSWYVPEYFEYTGSEPDSREYNQIEEGNISDISKHKLNNSQQSHNSSNEKSRSLYAPEHVGSSLSEPSSKEISPIDERRMSDISNYKTGQLRALDLSNYNRRRSLPVCEYQDKFSPNHQRMHRLNTYAGFSLSDINTLKTPNIPLRCQPNTSSESQREKFPEKVSLGLSLNKQNAREIQNVSDETQYRDFPYSNGSMNQSDASLPYPECSRKSCDRTFNRPLPEQQHYRNFVSLENASSQSPSRTNEDTDRRKTFDVSYDYNQRNKIRKLYDEIMSNPK